MRPTFNMAGSLAGAALLASGLVGSAFGQEFRLSGTGLSGRPGEVVQVGLVVTGGPVQTSAVNFTVSVEGANAQYVTSIDGDKAAPFAAFSIAENSPVRASGKEYRAVIYAPAGVAPVSTENATQVATLFVTLAANAPKDAAIELKLDKVGGAGTGFDAIDATTKLGLVGISDSAGVSKVPGGASPSTARPARFGNIITVLEVTTPALADVNFDGSASLLDRWQFTQGIPYTSQAVRIIGTNNSPFQIEVTGDNVFGSLGIKKRSTTSVVPTAADTLLFHSFRYSANKANAKDAAPVRISASALDGSVASNATFQELGNGDPVLVPAGGAFKTVTSVVYVPAEVLDDDGGKGFGISFDVLNFLKPVAVGTVFNVTDFVAEQVAIPAGAGTQIFQQDFTTGTGGFTASALPTTSGGREVSTSSTGGLTVTPTGGIFYDLANGPGDPDSLGKFPGLQYAYGWWGRSSIPDWVIQTGKIYRVETTVSSTAPTRAESHLFRLRFRPGTNGDYVYTSEVSSAGASASTWAPDADGETYTTYVSFPDEFAGQKVSFFFDSYGADISNGDKGSVTLKNINVKAFDRPTLSNTP